MDMTDWDWAHGLYDHLSTILQDDCSPTTEDLLPCGSLTMDDLRSSVQNITTDNLPSKETREQLDALMGLSYTKMSSAKLVSTCWRRLYTDACIFRTLADLLTNDVQMSKTTAETCIARLDRAIITAGPCGEGRLDIILGMITSIQTKCLSSETKIDHPLLVSDSFTERSRTSIPTLHTFSHCIPRLTDPPSFASFISHFSRYPFILPGYLREWPAMQEHPWKSLEYLRTVAGPGRVVPVEVGHDYREDNWSQKMMSWDEFLSGISRDTNEDGRPILYLAQHNLFTQFPALRDDIIIPDYVYASLPPPGEHPDYRPPGNKEQLVVNAWLGPRGTVSPAHTDPYFNFYAQVVGRKTVWLAPPRVTMSMYPYPPSRSTPSDQPHKPASNNTSPSMSNTSRVDVFTPAQSPTGDDDFPLFWKNVVPEAMCTTLEPGDLLFFPPGWWHAMRSEEPSFSVSMWF